MPFECIDGSSRTFPASHDVNTSVASTSTLPEPPSTQAIRASTQAIRGPAPRIVAFGIEVRPNIFFEHFCIRLTLRH